MQQPHGQRRRRAGGQRREQALEATVRVLAERGHERTRFSDVAEACGVAVSTLQFYFGSRDDMLIEALTHSTAQEVAALQAAAATAEDPWGQLVALVDRALDPDAVWVWRMLLEYWHAAAHDDELRAHSATWYQQYRSPFVAAVRAGIDRGDFRPALSPEDLVTVLVAILDGLTMPSLFAHPYLDRDGVRTAVLQQLAAALGRTAEVPDAAPRG